MGNADITPNSDPNFTGNLTVHKFFVPMVTRSVIVDRKTERMWEIMIKAKAYRRKPPPHSVKVHLESIHLDE